MSRFSEHSIKLEKTKIKKEHNMKMRVSFIEPELNAAEKETDGGAVLSVGKRRLLGRRIFTYLTDPLLLAT